MTTNWSIKMEPPAVTPVRFSAAFRLSEVTGGGG